ncbi:MAG: CPBP family intramembrane glutamic endopeptidase [Anaerolineae bacterium]
MNQTVLRYKTLLFYVFTFVISWISWLLMSWVYDGGELSPVVYIFSSLGGLGPLLSLVILEKLSQKAISVRDILGQIRIRKAERPWWFLPAIFALPLITILGNVGYVLLGREEVFRLIKPGPDELGISVVLVMIIHFVASLVTSPLFEEPGWRGFALGNLQSRFGRELGSLMVGLLWWVWHQPMNLPFGIQPTVHSFLFMIAASFMIDSLFNLSGRNLFTAMLAHQSMGTVFTFVYQGTDNWLQLGLLVGFVILLRFREVS